MIGVVHAVAKGGCGIVRCADKTVFVPGAMRGETVEFTIQGRGKGIWQGELQRVLEPSLQRVEAPCPHYRDCGGCNLQHMSYEEQLRCKADILADNLKKIAAIVWAEPVPVLPSPPWRYRSKIELQVRDSRLGFFRNKSHHVVAVRQCLLVSAAAERFLTELPALPAGSDGVLQLLDNGGELAARLQTSAGEIRWLTMERSLPFDLSPLSYRCGPEHFIQANRFQLRPMLDALTRCLPADAGAVADLFCGCGFFTLPLARHGRQVHALESDPNNLAALKANIDFNGIHNVQIQSADVLQAALPFLDLVVLDPPRGGLSPALIARIARSRAEKIIYFSCDSATFARDLRLFFKEGFSLRELQIIDNFPQTDHFEIFSLLEK